MAKPRTVARKFLHVDAAKNGSVYDLSIQGGGLTAAHLELLFSLLEIWSDGADALVTFPVIRELEDPALMATLDKRVADVRSGKVKTLPWDEVKARRIARESAEKKKPLPRSKVSPFEYTVPGKKKRGKRG
jgi:hypothetical protein